MRINASEGASTPQDDMPCPIYATFHCWDETFDQPDTVILYLGQVEKVNLNVSKSYELLYYILSTCYNLVVRICRKFK